MNVVCFLGGLIIGLLAGIVLTVYVEISLETEEYKEKENECK